MAAPDTRKYQGLITTGIVVGALLLLFIAGSAAILSIAARTQKLAKDVQQEFQDVEMVDQVVEEREIDYSMVYTEELLTERENINGFERQKAVTTFSNTNNKSAQQKLFELESETNRICAQIRSLRMQLNDTVNLTGDYGNAALTAAFFNTDNRSDNLLRELKKYRDKEIFNASTVNTPPLHSDTERSLPLDNGNSNNHLGVWDSSRFYNTPEKASQYLLELEIAVRYFEYDMIEIYTM
jgi:hypothetical protein